MVSLFSGAYWLQQTDGDTILAYLSLSNTSNFQVLVTESQQEFNVSSLTLDPSTGKLWVSDNITGGIFRCDPNAMNCQEVIASNNTGIQ